MKRRKAKSRLEKADLCAVLELQRDYTYLKCEVRRTLEYAFAVSRGDVVAKIQGDEDCDAICGVIGKMGDKIKELQRQIYKLQFPTNDNINYE